MVMLMIVFWWVWVLNSVSLLSWVIFMEIMFVLIIYCLNAGEVMGDLVGFLVVVVLFVGVVSLVVGLSLYVNMIRLVGKDKVGLAEL
nr:NADH Dehydrogenase subunit 4L [Moniliformis sp. XH-2020]